MKIITIGRSSSNDVNINDPLVSRAHCQIIQDDNGRFRLVDTNSRNGTFVNGTQRHGEVLLNKTDIIRIGNTTLPWQSYFSSAKGTETGGGTEIGPGGGRYYPPQPPVGSRPDNFLVWSILATVLCCMPFGIPAIVNSAKVDRLWGEGDYQGAKDAARRARTWFWWSFGLGLALYIFYILYYIIVGVALGLDWFS